MAPPRVAAAASAALLLLAALLGAVPGRASPPVPPQCVYTGLQFQIDCSDALRNASLALTGNVTTDPGEIKVSTEKLRAYLAEAGPPALACCEAMGSFNNLYCFCAPAMMDEFKEFVDLNQLTDIALWLERSCPAVNRPFTLYMEPNCPERPVWKATPSEAAASAAARQQPNATIIPIGNRTAAFLNNTGGAANATAQPGSVAVNKVTAAGAGAAAVDGGGASTVKASTNGRKKLRHHF